MCIVVLCLLLSQPNLTPSHIRIQLVHIGSSHVEQSIQNRRLWCQLCRCLSRVTDDVDVHGRWWQQQLHNLYVVRFRAGQVQWRQTPIALTVYLSTIVQEKIRHTHTVPATGAVQWLPAINRPEENVSPFWQQQLKMMRKYNCQRKYTKSRISELYTSKSPLSFFIQPNLLPVN